MLGTLTDDRYKELYDLIRGVNVLKTDIDYKAAFDASFVMKAHESMGM